MLPGHVLVPYDDTIIEGIRTQIAERLGYRREKRDDAPCGWVFYRPDGTEFFPYIDNVITVDYAWNAFLPRWTTDTDTALELIPAKCMVRMVRRPNNSPFPGFFTVEVGLEENCVASDFYSAPTLALAACFAFLETTKKETE